MKSARHEIVRWLLLALLVPALVSVGCQRDSESRLGEIRALQQAGEFEASIEPTRVLLHTEPSHAEANYRLGVALVQTGRKGLAIWPLQKASQSDDYGVESGLLLAQLLLGSKDYEEAIRAADQVLALDAERRSALYIRGEANIGASRPEDALTDVGRLLEKDPYDFQAQLIRVAALIDLDRLDEAEAAHLKLKEYGEQLGNPDKAARACAVLANFYTGTEQLEKGEAQYTECLETYSTHPVVMQAATNFYTDFEQPDKAIAIWQRAVEDVPEDFGLRSSLADLLVAQERKEEAEKVLADAVAIFDTVAAWQALSSFYQKTGDTQQARTALENALERAPGNPEGLQFALADLLVAEGEFERAAEIADGLKEPAYRNLIKGTVRLNQGDPEGALEIFESGLRLWPNNAGARYLAALAAEELGDTRRAMAEYREAIRVDQTATDAAFRLARLHLALGDFAAAQQFAERHTRNRPYTGPDPYVIAARAAGALGNFEAARASLDKLDERGADPLVVLVERAGLARVSQGPLAAAVLIEKEDLDYANPGSIAVLRALAHNLAAIHRGADAIERLEKAIAAQPANPEPYDLKARVLVNLGNRGEDARASFEKALEIDPNYPGALHGLASIAAAEGKLDEALLLSRRAAEFSEENADATYSAAQLSLVLGKQQEAIELLKQAIRIEPSHVGACNDLAWQLAISGQDLNLALELAERAARLKPGGNTLDTLGWVQLKRGNVNGAVKTLTAALDLDPDSSEIQYHLAVVLAKQDNAEEAKNLLRKALSGEPFTERQEAETELARLEGQ
jgi:tetratricopeptide (TPR) repeat protein